MDASTLEAACALFVPLLPVPYEGAVDGDPTTGVAVEMLAAEAAATAAGAAALRAITPTPKLLGQIARELLNCVGKDGKGTISKMQLKEMDARFRSLIGLPMLSDAAFHLEVTCHERSGKNALDAAELASFLGALLAGAAVQRGGTSTAVTEADSNLAEELVEELVEPAPMTPRRSPRSGDHNGWEQLSPEKLPPAPPPPSPAEALHLTLQTLAGTCWQVSLGPSATTEDLRLAATKAPLGLGCAHKLLLVAEGRLLQEGAELRAQGLLPSAPGTDAMVVNVICTTPPPELVRIECKGYGCGPSIRGSCGTFRRASAPRTKNGRPVYVRDEGLSAWNTAMRYHGPGGRFLLFEDHEVHGKRWALTDDQDWNAFSDRSYAFVASEAPHPGYLEGARWRVFCDKQYKVDQPREWVEHDSLVLNVEDAEGSPLQNVEPAS